MEFEAYSIGICSASICTSLPIEEAVKRMNDENPTFISSDWELADDEYFLDNKNLNGCNCPDHEGNKHYLLTC
jgi:hypothetical protein